MARPIPEEKLLAAGIAAGEKRGRLKTIALILEAQAAAIIAEQYSQVAAAVASGGVIAGSKALAQGLKGVWSGMWRTALYAPILMLFEQAELDTDQGKYQPPFDVRRPGFGEFLENYIHEFAEQVNSTSRDAIAEVLREAQEGGYSVDKTVKRIREEATEVSRSRAQTIARTELLRASRSAAHFKAESSGVVVGRRWRDSNDSRVREEHERMDGEYAPMGKPFSNGQMVVGETDVNCRCTAEFVLDPAITGGKTAANAVE